MVYAHPPPHPHHRHRPHRHHRHHRHHHHHHFLLIHHPRQNGHTWESLGCLKGQATVLTIEQHFVCCKKFAPNPRTLVSQYELKIWGVHHPFVCLVVGFWTAVIQKCLQKTAVVWWNQMWIQHVVATRDAVFWGFLQMGVPKVGGGLYCKCYKKWMI